MNFLNYNMLKNQPLDTIPVGTSEPLTEKVLQFGEGNFLRAFVDYMIDELNSNNIFNGSITVVQPIEKGMIHVLKEQDCLYTLFLRGLEGGKEVCVKKIITSIRKVVNPYTEYDFYINHAKNPELRFIVSNTTESGIVYKPNDKLTDEPPVSFPAKITAFLYERYKHFNGDRDKGLIFLPCELIDYNGTTLKNIVLKYISDWKLEKGFLDWVETANYFTNTLVDRIVTGYPKDEIDEITKELGYVDNLIDTGEIFHFWVIEGPETLKDELPFDKIGLNVVWTKDATPYKMRKVRILNGGHTCSVLAAYLAGKDTVGELVADEYFNAYLKKTLYEEVIQTLDLPYNDLKSFADAVFDRFANPFIKHYLLSISLNSVSKFKTRVIPSITEYYERKKALPQLLTFSFSALIAFYKSSEIRDNALIGHRDGQEYKIIDDLHVLAFFKDLWSSFDGTKESIMAISKSVCSKSEFWGLDLTSLDGFEETVGEHLYSIITEGMYSQVKKITC